MSISELIGKTLTKVENIEDEQIVFTTTDESEYMLHHSQDCCEMVTVNDICGDLDELINSPILKAEERTNSEENPEGVDLKELEYQESFTWTFYELATIKGSVNIRWYGESNGHYSESVDFCKSK